MPIKTEDLFNLGAVQDRTAQPNVVIPGVIGDAPDLTIDEFKSIAKESEEESKRKAELNKRILDIKNKTNLQPYQYPNLQVGTEKQSSMGQVVDVPKYEQVNLEKMEEITAEITSKYKEFINSLVSDKLEVLQNMSKDRMTYKDDLGFMHNQVFDEIKEKYPGLGKRDFMNIASPDFGPGLFETVLTNTVAKDKELDDAENKKGATTLDEDVFKDIFFNIEKTALNDKEVAIRKINDLVIPKQRKLNQLQAEGGDINEINKLLSEIKKHEKDIQKIATTTKYTPVGKEGLSVVKTEEVDEKLASSYFDKETTKYRQEKINEAKKNLEGTIDIQLEEKRINNPKLTDREAHELLYRSKAYNLQQLWVTGNTETANLKFNRSRNPQLYNKLKEAGINVGENLEVDVDVPLKDLFDAGYDGRDFSGLSGFLNNIDISEKDRKRLLNYESAIYRNRGELELLHKITYANQDPASFDHGGFGKQVVEVGGAAIMTRLGVHPYKASKIMAGGKGSTDSALLEEYQQLGNTYNEFYKEDIAKGKVDQLGFTKEQLKAIEKTFLEEVGEGFGHFVPMLIELGVISAATGAALTATGLARTLAGMRKAGGFKKTQYHAIMTMIEEGKMFTAGFDPGAGAGFYAGGQLTKDITPFKKRFKWMDPFFQKVVKGGPVGAASAQIAFNLETGIQDLLGNKDFKSTFDKHYGDLTFKDVVVESIVFSIAGATHVKKTDFMSTRRKYDAITELNNKMNELIKKPTGKTGKEGVDRALETTFAKDKDGGFLLDADGKPARIRPEGYEMMSREQQAKWEALNDAKRSLEQMVKVETTAIELDPNNKDFESNVDKMYTQPVNETIKKIHPDFPGFKVEFTENAKDPRFDKGAEAMYLEGKSGEPITVLFIKNKFSPEKLMHEISHTGMESYFKRNPREEIKFNENMAKLFSKFDFQAYDGTPLGEFIRNAYGIAPEQGGSLSKVGERVKQRKSLENREFLAYMFELLTDPKIYYQKVAPTFFKEAKQEMLSFLEESIGLKPKIRTPKQFVDYIGRLSMDARRGLGFQAKMARLADLDDISFLEIEFVENQRKNLEKSVEQGFSSKNLNKQKDVFLDNKKQSETLDAEGKKQETPLYTIDKHVFEPSGKIKYDNLEKFMRTNDYAEVFEKILGPQSVFNPLLRKGRDTQGRKIAEGVPKEFLPDFIEKVKEKLFTRLTKNFNPKKGGGSLYGYMTEIAIPFEATRVREEYVKGEKPAIPLDVKTGEKTMVEPEAPKSDLLERLETEIIIPGREKTKEKEGPQQYVDMIKDSFKTEKEKEKYTKDIDKAVVEADINIDVEKPTYKGVKKEVAGVEKITKKDKEGNIIIDSKTGKPKLFTPTKEADATPAGRLPKVLEVVADKYGIPLKRMLAQQTLNDKMRTKARNRILQTVNNWKKSLPDGETISGTATGIANTSWAFLYNFPGGRGRFAEGKTAAGKAPVTRRKNITTQEILDAVGIDANGNFLSGTKYDSAIKEYIKLEAQWTAVQSMMKTGKGRFTQAALAEVGSGRNEALASKMIKEFSEAFELPLEKTQDVLLNYAIGNKLLVEKKYRDFLDRFKDHEFFSDPRQAALWSAVEVEGLKGKTTATKFMGDFNTYWDNFKGELPDGITVKDIKNIKPKAFTTSSKKDFYTFVEVERLNRHVDLSVEFAKMLPKGFEKSLKLFDELIGLHQRVTMEKEGRYAKFEPAVDAITGKKVREIEGDLKGFIMDSRDGSPITNQPFTRGRERALENLGKNVSDLWKGIEIKFKSASAQEAGQRELAKAGGDFKKQLEIAEKYFFELDNKTKEDIYFAIEATKQEFIEAGKTKQEKLDRIEWMYNVARSNTNMRLGVRQLVPVKYVLFPESKITGEKIKLEHLKAMVTQSIQTANLVASGTFKKAGKEATSDFLGITSTKDLLDIVDAEGGLTNTSGLYRMSLLNPDILSQYRSVESGFKRTLLDDIRLKFQKEVGPKKFKELQTANKGVEKQMTEQLAKVGFASKDLTRGEKERRIKIIDNAIESGRDKKKTSRGGSFFDFDETLIDKGKNFIIAREPNTGKKVKISSGNWPIEGPKFAEQGYTFDFSDFVKVRGGVEGPMFKKFKERLAKFGPDHMYILTARPPEAATAIYGWLKSKGVEIPFKNITGLGNSTGEAKAMWMLEKFSEGYNDMYFVDDALPNVKAVKRVLDQLDIKSDVQQALASKNLGKEVNKIMEHSLDIGSEKVFSKAEAKVRGKDIKRRRVFMRDSAADLELLVEPLYGKGKKGIENKKWFKEEFIMPFERGIRDYNTARQSAKNDYINLRKQNKDVVKEISKEVEGTTFTNDMAMRVYLWNKAGFKIPDLAKTTEAKLVEHIQNNPKLQAYAEQFAKITKQEKGLKEPGENWWAETMAGEVTSMDRGVSRKQYLQEFIDIKNEIFTEQNLNKMESKLGTRWRENIEDMFDRMETGRTRSLKLDRGSAAMMNYLNGGIGTIMNFNTRSAVLQTISTTNFLNMRENNPIAAARAMGNVKQFSKDFMYIMNSDMLKQRRDGLSINVTEAEIASAAAASKNPIQSIIAKVLKAGYLPTKLADSFAISFGGATFYRNRIKMYEKQGMETKAAEKQAFLDFQVLSERTQQSSRADLLSKQQTSLIGRFILPFANTPMQMNRAGMKDILDISKGRFKGGRELTEKVGRISYYMGAQVAIFAGLQSALFAMLLNDEDVPEERIANTKSMMLNSTADSFLRGFGIQGAVISGFKNATQEYFKQSAKPGFIADYSEVGEDLLNISPPIGSKFGMLDRAGDRLRFGKDTPFKFELGNPKLEASLMSIQATTNAPVYSPYQNLFNLQHAMSDQYETWQRFLMAAGWTPYSVGIEEEKKKKKKKIKRKKTAAEILRERQMKFLQRR